MVFSYLLITKKTEYDNFNMHEKMFDKLTGFRSKKQQNILSVGDELNLKLKLKLKLWEDYILNSCSKTKIGYCLRNKQNMKPDLRY